MHYRTLGKTGLKVSEIGHGTWAMGSMWGPRDDVTARAALRRSLELGVNFFDTAYVYGRGHSERLLREVFQETAGRAYLATKCPPKVMAWPPKPGTSAEDAFPGDYLIKMTEASLDNLGRETLDLQQLHVWRSEWLREGSWWEAVERLKREGKIRHFGVSLNDHDPDSGLELVKSGLVDTVQVIFNLFDQTPRKNLFSLCQEHRVGVLVRVPLDEGGLTGQLKPGMVFAKGDWRSRYFQGNRLKETWDRSRQFQFLVRREVSSLAQAALKFCLSETAVSTVLVGMRSPKHVEENAAVSGMAGFSPEELANAHELAWPRNFYSTYG